MKLTATQVFGLAILFFTQGAFAQISITSPAEGSKVSSSTVVKGSCTGSSDVSLQGPGIDKGKKISCQKNKSGNYFSYSLSNAYKKMADGRVTIVASQSGKSAQRNFYKNVDVTTPTTNPPTTTTTRPPTTTTTRPPTTTTLPPTTTTTRPPTTTTTRPPVTTTTMPTTTTTMTPVGNLDPSKAPGQNFDLSLWKITLPVDSSGGFSGGAVEVKPIPAAYQRSPYFYTAADGAMVFMAPVAGATTGGSKYPRSELREMTASGGLAAWTVNQGGTLSATVAVNEVPVASSGAPGRVVIGQIHGPNDELCRLYYDNGKLYYYDDKSGPNKQELQYILKSSTGATTNIPLNDKFDYTILISNGYQTVTAVHNGVTYSATEALSSFWPGQALYYKAGVYVQVGKPGSGAGTTGSGQGKVSFYRLTRPSHP